MGSCLLRNAVHMEPLPWRGHHHIEPGQSSLLGQMYTSESRLQHYTQRLQLMAGRYFFGGIYYGKQQ